jgi:hypothetical protein
VLKKSPFPSEVADHSSCLLESLPLLILKKKEQHIAGDSLITWWMHQVKIIF